MKVSDWDPLDRVLLGFHIIAHICEDLTDVVRRGFEFLFMPDISLPDLIRKRPYVLLQSVAQDDFVARERLKWPRV